MGVETAFTGKQLYKARALYEEEKHSLKLQLNSVHENVNVLKRENENLRFSLTHSQADLETFRKHERWESSRRMQEMHQRRKASLHYHREEFERAHSVEHTLECFVCIVLNAQMSHCMCHAVCLHTIVIASYAKM